MNWLTSVSDNFKGRIGNLVNDHAWIRLILLDYKNHYLIKFILYFSDLERADQRKQRWSKHCC